MMATRHQSALRFFSENCDVRHRQWERPCTNNLRFGAGMCRPIFNEGNYRWMCKKRQAKFAS
jgi:hypothetical protein